MIYLLFFKIAFVEIWKVFVKQNFSAAEVILLDFFSLNWSQ